MASADTSIFSFRVGGYPLDTFRVISFTGHETISRFYEFTITAIAFDLDLAYDDGIGTSATLIVRSKDYEITHHGMITHFNQVPDSDGTLMLNSTYRFTVEPRFKYMHYVVQSRIFQNQSVQEIVESVLGEYYTKGSDFKFEAKDSFPKREFTVQYNESDLDFVQRLLEEEGIYYFFNHEGDREVLVMANQPQSIKPVPNTPSLPLRAEIGMHVEAEEYVDSLNRSVRFVTGRATLKDYNYRTPNIDVIGTYALEGTGEYYHFGDHVKSPDEAQRIARIRTEMFACQRETYSGTSVSRSIRPGYRFKLENAGAEGFTAEYLVTSIRHNGDLGQDKDSGGDINRPIPRYSNDFTAVLAKIPFRPQLYTAKPKAPGILTAKVDGQKGSYAYLDDEGRYRMKLFFDRTDEKDGKASKAIRLAQPYAGNGYGMHFPLHTDTEIAIGFIDGDLDRPIGLGAIPNPVKGSPVKAGNKSQNMIKSHSGHSVTLDDKEGKTGIHLASTGKHTISMDDSAGTKGISMGTTDGFAMSLDDAGKKASISTPGGHSLTLTDQGTAIHIISTGKLHIDLDDSAKSITMADSGGTNHVIVDAAGKNIDIAAVTNVVIKGDSSISLTSGSSSITMAKDGTITISGVKVSITGSESVTIGDKSINITGSDKVALNSSKEVGMTVASSTVACKPDGVSTSGAKISASAIGIHEIGGALIKIG